MVEQLAFQLGEGGSIPTSPLQFNFRSVSVQMANNLFVKHHYAHRAVPISESFGVFKIGGLQDFLGAISFGKPASPRVTEGCCGKENAGKVYELNRLWLSDECPKYTESRFIGWSLRELKKLHPNWILVSYADTEQAHKGTIYRATNWIYTGLTEKRTDPIMTTVKHNRHAFEKGLPQKARSRKHRYFYFLHKHDIEYLKYPIVGWGNEVGSDIEL